MARGKTLGRTGRWLVLFAVVILVVFAYRYLAPWPYRTTVTSAAQKNHLSPYLVAAVIRVESSFRPSVVSGRGAVGLMQLLPGTAVWIGNQMGEPTPITATGLSDVTRNVTLGSWYLNHLLSLYHGNLTLALAAYNSGPRTVTNWIASGVLNPKHPNYRHIPYPETRNFVFRVRFYQRTYQLMYGWTVFTNTDTGGG